MKQLSNGQIETIIQPYGVAPTADLCDQIRTYIDLLLRWNRRISLTTVTDPLEVLRFHFGESLFAVPTVPIRHGRLADVGSGAGFPAVPIRMVCNDLGVILIESNQKKAAFLAEVVRELKLSDVEVYRGRMQDLPLKQNHAKFVTARALGIDKAFLNWAHAAIGPEGSVVLWLGDADAKRISRESGWIWRDSIRIPQSDRRFILVGSKT